MGGFERFDATPPNKTKMKVGEKVLMMIKILYLSISLYLGRTCKNDQRSKKWPKK